ncbi:hypothetical protein LINPERHAP1_LOCUS15315 [Linum perenne]
MSHKTSNIGPKTFDCVFIGYATNSAAYRFMRLDDRSVCEYRDAEFFEEIFPMLQQRTNLRIGAAEESITQNEPSHSLRSD